MLELFVELLLLLLLKSFWNCADGDAASGLDRGGDERSLGETLRAPSWVRRRSAAIVKGDDLAWEGQIRRINRCRYQRP